MCRVVDSSGTVSALPPPAPPHSPSNPTTRTLPLPTRSPSAPRPPLTRTSRRPRTSPPSTTHSRSTTTSTSTRARPFLLASSLTLVVSSPRPHGGGSSLSRDNRLDRPPPSRIPSSSDDRCVPDAGCSSVPCRASTSAPSDSDRPRCFIRAGFGCAGSDAVLSLHGRRSSSPPALIARSIRFARTRTSSLSHPWISPSKLASGYGRGVV